jgi:hypothetical protein
LRKCTLTILPRSPNQRITSKISRADADMRDGELRPDPVIGIVPRPDLHADIHDYFSARRATALTDKLVISSKLPGSHGADSRLRLFWLGRQVR